MCRVRRTATPYNQAASPRWMGPSLPEYQDPRMPGMMPWPQRSHRMHGPGSGAQGTGGASWRLRLSLPDVVDGTSSPSAMARFDWCDGGGQRACQQRGTARVCFTSRGCDCEGICGSASQDPTAVVEARTPDHHSGQPRALKLPSAQLGVVHKRRQRKTLPFISSRMLEPQSGGLADEDASQSMSCLS